MRGPGGSDGEQETMQPVVRRAVHRYLQSLSPGKILDCPAGTGWLRTELAKDGWDYHGADLYTNPDIPQFKVADMNARYPWDDGEFDVITCLEGIEHIENYHHMMRECSRILRPGGSLILSTPNPLNIKSRRRYFWSAHWYGFPHLVHMPAEGEHLHMSPINLSFLRAFAAKYELEFERLHTLPIRPSMYRYVPHAITVKAYGFLKGVSRDREHREWMRLLNSFNLLLNDGMVVSFRRSPAAIGGATSSTDRQRTAA